MADDPELKAMRDVVDALEPLEESTRARVLEWAMRRFDIQRTGRRGSSHVPAHQVSERELESSGSEEAVEFVDLFDRSQPGAEAERALVGGYWFQIIRGKGEFQAQEVNNALKDVGHGVSNITVGFNNLQRRTPALVRQVAKSGRTKQARKRYKLTSAGVARVQAMLRGRGGDGEA